MNNKYKALFWRKSMLSIKEQNNIYDQAMEYINTKNWKAYILGAGEGGRKLKEQLEKRGFEIDGFVCGT